VSLPQPPAGARRPSWSIAAFVGALESLFSRRGVDAAIEAPSERAIAAVSPDYARLVNTLPDPILVVSGSDPEDPAARRYIFANPAARELLRMDHEQGLLVSAIRDPQVLEAVDEALFGGIAADCVYEIAGAQAKVLRVQARPLAEAADGERLAVLSFRDETELRRVERTRVDFLANASHELRTPLASLSGFIETLRGHARADEGARDRFLGIMQAQAERMSRLIDDLMSLSRIELNEHIAPEDEVDLAQVVLDVIDAATPMARSRGVTLEPHLTPKGLACIVADRDQIIQVAQNLVDNALKYSPGGATIRIGVGAGLTAGQAAAAERPHAARLSLLTPDRTHETYAALRVSDEGAGIAREHLPRLTERFYRVEGQKSGERAGTGLGLAIVKHIANRHRGGLVVESTEGQGTTFTAYFPLKAPAVSGQPPGAVAKVS
jgi:two-component system phosphate regulon sensor histidine kinase PhoR